ncbi:MAG: N-acetylmuramoyl-L-alanine amidase [Rhodospirillales bacterium]|nr:N-acetylmuramoyl-L-alanine amidase [Rhodospirillales bacterium]
MSDYAYAKAEVKEVRLAAHKDKTRFVLDITEKVSFRIFTLSNPYRVVVDLPEMDWLNEENLKKKAGGHVANFRYGLFIPGTSRLVLDVKGPVKIKKSFILPPANGKPYRFVLDLVGTSPDQFMADMKARKAKARPPAAARAIIPLPRTLERSQKPKGAKRVVVIDPGHGGVDPGAISLNGAYEKRITLAVAKEIKKQLEATGKFKAILTRNRDIFIPLRERVNIARRADAELFISIHADTIKNRRIRGASVYTLSEKASDKEAAALAERENKADVIGGMDLSHESKEVSDILIDLARRDTMNESAHFAEGLVKKLKGRIKVLRNTHRFAGFAVLKAPDVPSVLVELGFLSNRHDEKALRNPKYREKIGMGVADAVSYYFKKVEKAQGS